MTDSTEDPNPPFKAEFEQRITLMGATKLQLELQFTPDGGQGWTARGIASVTRGSTHPPLDLHFDNVSGTLSYNPLSGVLPQESRLSLRSEATIGTWLTVDLVAETESSPAFEKQLEFTGEYTWAEGEPNQVTDVQVTMTNQTVPAVS